MPSLHLILLGFISLACASSASAQIVNQPTEIILSTPPSTFSDRAGQWPSVDTPQDMIKPEGQSLADHLNSVPGVQSRDDGSPTVSIRGSVQADRVLKLYDGIPLNFADGIGGSNIFVPTEALSSIRVFKGPASVFYGSSAMGGAIDYRSRIFERPALRASLADDTGLVGPRSIFGSAPFRLNAESAEPNFQVTGFHERRPGRFRYQSTSTPLSGRRENNWTETTRATLTGDTEWNGFKIKPRLVAAQQIGESPGAIDAPYHTTSDFKGTLASIGLSRQVNEELELGIRLTDARLDGTYDRATSSESFSNSKRTSLSADANYLIASTAIMRSFVDFDFDEFSATYVQNQRLNERDVELGQTYQIPLSQQLSLEPAYRYRSSSGDWFKSIALVNELERVRTWVLYAEGFRAPSLSDRFASYTDFRGNPGLKPERSYSVEVGFLKAPERRYGNFGEGLSYGASLYSTEYFDFVDTMALGGGLNTKTNTGRARSQGIEASLGYAYKIWTFDFGYNWMEAKNLDNSEVLRLSPRHQLVARLSQQLGPIVFEIEDTYWSEFYDRDMANTLKRLPPWNKVDFNVRTLGLADWEFRGGVINVLDEPRELTLGFPEPQRRFYLSALRYF